MDKATLVGKSDREVEGLIIDALRLANIPVSFFDWDYVPQLDELQLIVATPLYDTVGPHEANARVLDALSSRGVYEDMPIRRIFVKSPKDPAVKALEQGLKFRTEGSIHVLEAERPNRNHRYTVFFTPYLGPGGSVPSQTITGDEALRTFLEHRLKIWPHIIDGALSELRTKRNVSIDHVQLTRREAKRLGLA